MPDLSARLAAGTAYHRHLVSQFKRILGRPLSLQEAEMLPPKLDLILTPILGAAPLASQADEASYVMYTPTEMS
jgi:hypothetical protein